MLPPKCAHPPWRNMESSALRSSPAGPGPISGSKKRPGMNAAWFMKASSPGPRVSSYTNSAAFTAMNAQLTIAGRRARFRSRSGSMRRSIRRRSRRYPAGTLIRGATIKALVVGAFAVWMWCGLGLAVGDLLRRRELDTAGPLRWQPGSAEVDALRAFLNAADRQIPPGPLAFRGAYDRRPAAVSEYRWAAYLLPHREVLPLGFRGAPGPRYLAVFRGVDPPNVKWVLRARLADGAVFERVRE